MPSTVPALRRLHALFAMLLLAAAGALPAWAQGGPPPHVRQAISAVEAMLGGDGDASLQAFADQHLEPEYRAGFEPAALLEHLRKLRAAADQALGNVMVEREDDGLHLIVSDVREAEYLLTVDATGRITRLDLLRTGPEKPDAASRITWDSLPVALRDAEARGFSGVVLAIRDGKPVLREAYGVADREEERRTGIDDIYGIGSTPIDFTVTAALLLAQRGKLALDDSIGKYLPRVPDDKRAITLRHLMTGKSGLPNFHHVEGKDWDADLAWIDRDTAIARILAQPLLFEPGKGDAHSHSAFGLVAAIVEIVSGQGYREFVRHEVLAPAGMQRTGFNGETMGLKRADFAIGYGANSVGLPNIPPNWGPTSWLVMGSGGMYSTLADMQRYYEAIDSGKILTGTWRQWQARAGVDVGGSDQGYFIFHASDGKSTRILLLINGEGRAPEMRALTRALGQLVMPPGTRT